MKSKILIIFFSLLHFDLCFSKNIFIEAKNITIEKKNEISIFKEDVLVKTEDNYEIKSQYGELNKKSGILILKENVMESIKIITLLKRNLPSTMKFQKY